MFIKCNNKHTLTIRTSIWPDPSLTVLALPPTIEQYPAVTHKQFLYVESWFAACVVGGAAFNEDCMTVVLKIIIVS